MELIVKNIDDFDTNYIKNFKNRINKTKQDRINKIVDISERNKSIISEILLSLLLEKKGIDYDLLKIKYSENGKPFINNNLFYSISHSKNYIAVAISNKNIGIDIEEKDSFNINNLDVYCNNKEKTYINNVKNRLIRSIKIFTVKEAYIKYRDLSIFDIKNINVIKNNKLFIEECNIRSINKNNYVISICEEK